MSKWIAWVKELMAWLKGLFLFASLWLRDFNKKVDEVQGQAGELIDTVQDGLEDGADVVDKVLKKDEEVK